MSSTCTLRELHGVIQVAMGWESIHLFQFRLRSRRYGSWELSASSPDVALAAMRLRKGARFAYDYDLNVPWRHEVRIEDHLPIASNKVPPTCTGGDGACPLEDCGGLRGYRAGLNEATSWCARATTRTGTSSAPSRGSVQRPGRPPGGCDLR